MLGRKFLHLFLRVWYRLPCAQPYRVHLRLHLLHRPHRLLYRNQLETCFGMILLQLPPQRLSILYLSLLPSLPINRHLSCNTEVLGLFRNKTQVPSVRDRRLRHQLQIRLALQLLLRRVSNYYHKSSVSFSHINNFVAQRDLFSDEEDSAAAAVPDNSVEIGNLQNQLNSTGKSLDHTKAERQNMEQTLAAQASQLSALQKQLSSAKAAFETETRLLDALRGKIC